MSSDLRGQGAGSHIRQQIALSQSASRDSIQNIQRLLKLLADRHKDKYGAVDPGRVDGSFGTETKDAIRKFQDISGVPAGSQSSDELVADILAALAQMTAEQPAEADPVIAMRAVDADAGSSPLGSAPATPTANATQEAKAEKTSAAVGAGAPAAASAAPDEAAVSPATGGALTIDTASPKQRETAAVVNPRQAVQAPESARATIAEALKAGAGTGKAGERNSDASAPEIRTEPRRDSTATTPAIIDRRLIVQATKGSGAARVYFVQVASLRSLTSAKREWRRIFGENRAALTGEQVYFERADIKDQGVFHRILVGPMMEPDAAKTLCGYLKANDQSCVVVGRNIKDLPTAEKESGETPTVAAANSDGSAPPPENIVPTQATTTAQTAPAADKAATSVQSARNADPGNAAAAAAGAAPANPTPSPATRPTTSPSAADPAAAPSGQATETALEREMQETATESQDSTAPAAGTAHASAISSDLPPTPGPPGKPLVIDLTTVAEPPQPENTPRNAPTADFGDFLAATSSEPASAADGAGTAAAPVAGGGADETSSLFSSGASQTIIAAAALIAAIGLFWTMRRRRSRKSSSLSQVLQTSILPFVGNTPSASAPDDPLAALEMDFDSASLRESRSVRDRFLREILGEQVEAEDFSPKEESAIRVNSSLKSLLVSDPSQYKSIFLNWIFMSRVGAALNQKDITLEELNMNFGREFNLLQNYFKIHLLELDDRHRIREELPGLFYCLQLAQRSKRHTSSTSRFGTT